MMRYTQYFMPTLKENPAEAQILSHRFMLRAGMIRQSAAGIYTWLPLANRVLSKISTIIREEHDRAGCMEVIMPTIQSAELWKESGRYEAYGKEMLRIKDRHDRELLYGPTAEEVITDIFRTYVKSYKDLPKMFYNIQWKFRDEIRPRFGVMRGREFLMKDNYSFDIDQEAAKATYFKAFEVYLKIFKRMGLVAIPVKADTGPIGGDLSHEFQILAETGESQFYYDKRYVDFKGQSVNPEDMKDLYAASDEMHNPETCPVPADDLRTARGIEVGHIFYFGTKYTDAMNVTVMGPQGKPIVPHMGSYGIGVSRLVGAIIEASHDEHGIIWPEPVAPFKVALINLKVGQEDCDRICLNLYEKLQTSHVEVFYDDRDTSPGVKLADMDLVGFPWQIIVGPRGAQSGTVEAKNRRTGEKVELSTEAALAKFVG